MKPKKMDWVLIDGERQYFTLDDVLDIVDNKQNKSYTIIFNDGEAWVAVPLRKAIYNKFIKIKERRNQK